MLGDYQMLRISMALPLTLLLAACTTTHTRGNVDVLKIGDSKGTVLKTLQASNERNQLRTDDHDYLEFENRINDGNHLWLDLNNLDADDYEWIMRHNAWVYIHPEKPWTYTVMFENDRVTKIEQLNAFFHDWP